MKLYFIFSILFAVLIFIILFSGCVNNIDNNIIDDKNKTDAKNITPDDLEENNFVDINPCDLLSKTFAEQLLKEQVKDAQLKDTIAPSGKSCTYITNKMIDNRKIDLTIYQDEIIKDEGMFPGTTEYYNRLKNAKQLASDLTITNLNYGDNSYFDGYFIHVLKGKTYLFIEVSPEKQTASSSQEMDIKLKASRLELEKQVVEEVIKKLN